MWSTRNVPASSPSAGTGLPGGMRSEHGAAVTWERLHHLQRIPREVMCPREQRRMLNAPVLASPRHAPRRDDSEDRNQELRSWAIGMGTLGRRTFAYCAQRKPTKLPYSRESSPLRCETLRRIGLSVCHDPPLTSLPCPNSNRPSDESHSETFPSMSCTPATVAPDGWVPTADVPNQAESGLHAALSFVGGALPHGNTVVAALLAAQYHSWTVGNRLPLNVQYASACFHVTQLMGCCSLPGWRQLQKSGRDPDSGSLHFPVFTQSA
jgi:hypothetical protein